MIQLIWILLFFITLSSAKAQGVFNAIYPIGENPNLGYKTSMVPSIEKILFEANPILRLPVYNNFIKKLQSGHLYKSGSTLYFSYKPQLRMYTHNSLPVKTPTYKIGLGFQKLFRLKETKNKKNQMFAFSVESGHYSNGQSKSAFNKNFDDGSSSSDSVYRLITPDTNLSNILNRESGNFSTNFTEIIINYRLIPTLDEDNKPKSAFSIYAGWNRYHDKIFLLANIGGYSNEDIKIYGKNRWLAGLEYFFTLKDASWLKKTVKSNRVSVSSNFEYISTPHPFVNPVRGELKSTIYFNNNIGIFIAGIYGHDNYNYRFVDSGFQFFTGITFDIFPPFEIK